MLSRYEINNHISHDSNAYSSTSLLQLLPNLKLFKIHIYNLYQSIKDCYITFLDLYMFNVFQKNSIFKKMSLLGKLMVYFLEFSDMSREFDINLG
jgi:hypothetical protein